MKQIKQFNEPDEEEEPEEEVEFPEELEEEDDEQLPNTIGDDAGDDLTSDLLNDTEEDLDSAKRTFFFEDTKQGLKFKFCSDVDDIYTLANLCLQFRGQWVKDTNGKLDRSYVS